MVVDLSTSLNLWPSGSMRDTKRKILVSVCVLLYFYILACAHANIPAQQYTHAHTKFLPPTNTPYTQSGSYVVYMFIYVH